MRLLSILPMVNERLIHFHLLLLFAKIIGKQHIGNFLFYQISKVFLRLSISLSSLTHSFTWCFCLFLRLCLALCVYLELITQRIRLISNIFKRNDVTQLVERKSRTFHIEFVSLIEMSSEQNVSLLYSMMPKISYGKSIGKRLRHTSDSVEGDLVFLSLYCC